MAREKTIEAACVTLITDRGGMLTKGDADRQRGCPDRIGSYRGIPLALEFKQPGQLGHRDRRIAQGIQLRKWRDAGAIAIYVDNVQQLAMLLNYIDQLLTAHPHPRPAYVVALANATWPLPPIPAIVHVDSETVPA